MIRFSKWLSPPYKISVLTALLALLLSSVDNLTFLSRAFQVIDKTDTLGLGFKIALFVCLNALFTILLSLGGFRPLFKPFAGIIIITAAVISYFMDNYGVIINAAMIQNVLETDQKEAFELLNFGIFWHVGIFGLLPAVLLYICPIHYQPFPQGIVEQGAYDRHCCNNYWGACL